MMKKKVLTAALLVFLPFLLTACTLQDLPVIGSLFKKVGPDANAPVTLTMWGLWERPETMEVLISKYQETHPNVTINYEDRSVLKLGDYKQAVLSRLGQEGAPNIVRVHNSWISRMKGNIVPAPSDVMSAAEYAETFYPVATEEAVMDGSVYGMPLYYDGLVLVYNKDHFAEIDQVEAPTAWEEFRRLALRLTIRGEDNKLVRGGAALGTVGNVDFFSDIIGMMFVQAGVTSATDYDSQAAQDALQFYANFTREDGVWDATMPEASAAFAQEKVSMIFVPTWNLLDIIKARPDMNIGVAPVPQAVADKPATWASFWMEVVPAGTGEAEQKASWDFLKFLSSEEAQLMLYDESAKFREFGAAYSVKSLAPQLAANEYLSPLLNTAPFASSNVIAARSGNDPHIDAMSAAVEEALRGRRVQEALAAAKEVITTTP